MAQAASGSSRRHLLIIDDDDRIRLLLKEYLSAEGFRVSAAADADAARRLLESLCFDLLIVDVMMPGEDGYAFTDWLRGRPGAAGSLPVIILTARGLPGERIEGLRLGADDYLAKPFEPRELTLRIEAVLRRSGAAGPAERVQMGEVVFDIPRGELTRDGAPIRLTETETKLLQQLARSANAPVDRFDLLGPDRDGGRAVDIQVTRLRRKIEHDPANPRYLQTVRGVGYRLAPD
ncbi:MAG: response regulator [Caulobacteraceae bacterium]